MHQSSIGRLLAHVEKRDDGCWQWSGCINPGGYGVFGIYGRNTAAHRISYEMFTGPIPDGLTIDHLCRNTGCVNPDHLEAVTMTENIRRSCSAGGLNARKTHCPRGHEYTPENTIRGRHLKYRRCRICDGEQHKRAQAKVNQKRAEQRAMRSDNCPNGHIYMPETTIQIRGVRRCTICLETHKQRGIASAHARKDTAWRKRHGISPDIPLTYRDKVLAGNNFVAVHARTTHCPRGHPYSEENTRINRGRRHCRECHKLTEREQRRNLRTAS
jgi:CxxC motif-containing protein